VTVLRATDPQTLTVTVEQQIRDTVQQLTETLAAIRSERVQLEDDIAACGAASLRW